MKKRYLMIKIEDKKDCLGCYACQQACPKRCIRMIPDSEGFVYPDVDIDKCIDCHICEKICPSSKKLEDRTPIKVYAAYNPDNDIRIESSSGGVFTYIAKQIINKGGVVFGAVFDNKWNVVHTYTDNVDGLAKMRGSKYVQSDINETYSKAKEFLNAGRLVMFSGTPCQISGLKYYLRKEYDNLLTVDFVCAGVPSPKSWNEYLGELSKKAAFKAADGGNTVLNSSLNAMSLIRDIRFRDKTYGWGKFRFVVRTKSASKADKNSVLLSDIHYKNPYFYLFLQGCMKRFSCYHCPMKEGRSQSDITMGDYWHIDYDNSIPNDQKGVSMLLVWNDVGMSYLQGLVMSERTYEHAVKANPTIQISPPASVLRNSFFSLDDKFGFINAFRIVRSRDILVRAINKILRIIKVQQKIKK